MNRAKDNASQRKRRARMRRIDYLPSPLSVAIIEAKRANVARAHLSVNSRVLDAILAEWATLTGIAGQPQIAELMKAASDGPGIVRHTRAIDYGALLFQPPATSEGRCGARTKAGTPCRCLSAGKNRRCRYHGGCSTGPRTPEGRAKSLANLRQYRKPAGKMPESVGGANSGSQATT